MEKKNKTNPEKKKEKKEKGNSIYPTTGIHSGRRPLSFSSIYMF